MDFRHLHSVLIIAALVGIFLTLQRHHRSARVRFWLAAWVLMLLHFTFRLFPAPAGTFAYHLSTAFDNASLLAAGFAFLISVTGACDRPRARLCLMAVLGIPSVALSALLTWRMASPWPATACLLIIAGGGAACGISWRRVAPQAVFATGAIVAGAGVAVYRVWTEGVVSGYLVALAVLYALVGVLFWRSYRRSSPGVVMTVAAFEMWAAVWVIAAFFQNFATRGMPSELWNVPKLLVAFGMIVTLLEDESLAAQRAGESARQAGVQIQRFADVTSRLLSGVDARALTCHIAEVIAEATTFERILILLADEQRHLEIAGHAGVSQPVLQEVGELIRTVTIERIEELCTRSRRIAGNSFIWRPEEGAAVSPTTRTYAPNPFWTAGDELLVPLRSPRGVIVGAISLDDPRDVTRVTPQEMSKIEMLAADLGVAIENALLQRQLLVSEKLAAVGQLVAGVAHELNNPLTAVLGYSEVLADRAGNDGLRRELGIVHREAMRMKRVIESLLRFAQQNKSERKSLEVLPLIEDVMRLRSFDRNRGVQVVTRVPATLPRIAGDENQLKQAFLNVLTNAIDAVENASEKRVTIEGRVQGDRVLLTFMDSGAGFSDLNRVFDPFFTTKSVGKGTGLGLSICYGILKGHGGDIYAFNLHPTGACIAMELPLAAEEAAKAAGAGETQPLL